MRNYVGYFKMIRKSLLLSLIIYFPATAQLIIEKPLDILGGITGGTIQASADPTITLNTINNVFDGNPLTMAGVQSTHHLTVTLAFTDSAEFSRSKVFFWSTGEWSLEIADNENDLNLGTGSYQLLVNLRSHGAFAADSVDFPEVSARYVRLKAQNLAYDYVYLGEWTLTGNVSLTQLYIYPRPVKVIPGTTLNLKVKALDAENNLYDLPVNNPAIWSTGSSSIATVGEFGELTGVNIGTTTVSVRDFGNHIFGTTSVSVLSDFQSVKAPTKNVKVALVLQNPVIDSTNNRRINQVWSWSNPTSLVTQIIEDFNYASGGVINFQVVETIDDDHIFTEISGVPMTMDQIIYYFTPSNNRLYGRTTPGTLQYMAEIQGIVRFNYNAMVDYYDFDTKRNNGLIDEIWVYTFPFGGMYESQLMGPGAFWYNSPPLAHPGLNKLLSVMGWNYERGVAEALHSVGHRAESAMSYAYGRWQGNPPPEDPNNWEIFAQIELRTPGQAHCGNIHYPPNGESDYDYANTRYVITYADNWKRYPLLLNQTRSVNRSEWSYPGGDYQRGFMIWWFGHLPRFEGVHEGMLNNWWHYIVDYEEAVALANSTPWVGIEDHPEPGVLRGYRLEQNYPNPFNPATTFTFSLPSSAQVTLSIYDILGRRIQTVTEGKYPAGEHHIRFDATGFSSGIYFYQLSAGDFKESRKMILMK